MLNDKKTILIVKWTQEVRKVQTVEKLQNKMNTNTAHKCYNNKNKRYCECESLINISHIVVITHWIKILLKILTYGKRNIGECDAEIDGYNISNSG